MEPKSPIELFGVECGHGWARLIEPIVAAARDNNIEILQIKEKFGGLRVYLGTAPDWLHDMCNLMEDLSYHVCEDCGKPGIIRDGGWVRTLCEECYGKGR